MRDLVDKAIAYALTGEVDPDDALVAAQKLLDEKREEEQAEKERLRGVEL